jgi:hypothetical protein
LKKKKKKKTSAKEQRCDRARYSFKIVFCSRIMKQKVILIGRLVWTRRPRPALEGQGFDQHTKGVFILL